MSHDGGQPRQAGGDVGAVAVPASQRVHGEGVTQRVDDRTAPPGPGAESRCSDQAGEGLVGAVVGGAGAGAGGQQGGGGPGGGQAGAGAGGGRARGGGWGGGRGAGAALGRA